MTHWTPRTPVGTGIKGVLTVQLTGITEELDLELLTISAVEELAGVSEPEPSHIVSVYGVDHPGIVHAVSSALAERGITITDLNTRLAGEAEQPLYALMMEVAVPDDAVADVTEALEGAGAAQGVEVTVRPLEADVL